MQDELSNVSRSRRHSHQLTGLCMVGLYHSTQSPDCGVAEQKNGIGCSPDPTFPIQIRLNTLTGGYISYLPVVRMDVIVNTENNDREMHY